MANEPAISFSADRRQMLRLKEQLLTLTFSSNEKKIFANKVGTSVRNDSRKRVREQRTLEGKSMAPRKERKSYGGTKRNRRKMLRGLSRLMSLKASTDGTGRVGWKNPITAKIAMRHHKGIPEPTGRIKASRQDDYVRRKAMCPRQLAKDLKAAGYKHEYRKANGKLGYKRVSVKWIMENVRRGAASKALRYLQRRDAKQKWRIELPARAVLGTSKKNANELKTEIIREMLKEMKLA